MRPGCRHRPDIRADAVEHNAPLDMLITEALIWRKRISRQLVEITRHQLIQRGRPLPVRGVKSLKTGRCFQESKLGG